RPLLGDAQLSLCPRQRLFVPAEEARVGDFLAGGKSCKALKTHVYTGHVRRRVKRLTLIFDREAGVPLAGCGPANREGLDRALNWAVEHDLHVADFREVQPSLVGVEAEAELRIGETIVA